MSYVFALLCGIVARIEISCSELHMVTAMASKALPCRSREPYISLDHLVQSIDVGLGTHRLAQISNGVAPLVGGWDISARAVILHMQYWK